MRMMPDLRVSGERQQYIYSLYAVDAIGLALGAEDALEFRLLGLAAFGALFLVAVECADGLELEA